MSEDNNKLIVKKTQELLKEYGHEVKTGHLYEVFSKLSDERSWNVANAKKISFKEKVLNLLTKPAIPTNIRLDEYKKLYLDWYSQKTSNYILLGLLKDDNKNFRLLLKDMILEPNALFVGNMGTGKSLAMASSVFSFIKKNPENSLVFLVDPLKGANDFAPLFEFPKVFPILSSEDGIRKTIELLWEELLSRTASFNKFKAEDLYDYEKKSETSLDRCLLVLEEFQAIPNVSLNFDLEFKIPGTPAYKLHQLLRLGRSYGIWIFAAAGKVTKSDIPTELLNNFTQKFVFRTSQSESAYVLANTLAANIRSDEKGLSLTEYGYVQFPNFSQEEQTELLKDTPRVSNFNCIFLSNEAIVDFLNNKNEEKIYESKSLDYLITNLNDQNKEIVIKIILKQQNYSIFKEFDFKIDKFAVNYLIEKSGEKNLVSIKNKIQVKHLIQMKEAMSEYQTSKGTIYSLEESIPLEIQKIALENHIVLVDREDLKLSK